MFSLKVLFIFLINVVSYSFASSELKICGPVNMQLNSSTIKFDSLNEMRLFLRNASQLDRINIEIPFTLTPEFCDSIVDAGIYLGRVYDSDITSINDKYIGSTGSKVSKSFQATILERVYGIPKDNLNCNGINLLKMEINRLIPGRIGPIEQCFVFTKLDEATSKAELSKFLKVDSFKHFAFIFLALAPLFLTIFIGDTRGIIFRKFGSFLVLSGIFSLSLSGYFHTFIANNEVMFKINASIVSLFLFSLFDLVITRWKFSFEKINKLLLFLSLSIINFSPTIAFSNRIYSLTLVFYNVLLLSVLVYLIRRVFLNDKSITQKIQWFAFLILTVGISFDIGRFFQLHSLPNMSPWFVVAGTIVIGSTFMFDVKDMFEKAHELERNKKNIEIGKLSSQVAHDIRSPLAALNMITRSLQDIPEDKRLMIRNSIQRINDIANDLLNRGKKSANAAKDNSNHQLTDSPVIETKKTTEVILLPALIDSLVSEKRIQYRDQIQVQIQSDLKNSFGDFVLADGKELMRVLSNLINNSVEAFDNKGGEVTVSIEKNAQPAFGQSSNMPSSQSEAEACKSMLLITVKDNGKGIPANVLEKLGDIGVSFGKEGSQSGSGIGIYHAKKTIEEFGGKFKIISQVGVGTEVQIYLPKTKSPVWFLESLKIPNNSLVISLDDDISIHQIWKGRLSSLNASAHQVQLQSFTSAEEFKKFVLFKTNFNSDAKNTTQTSLNTEDVVVVNQFYLIDYELLGQNTNGLKIIEELGLQNNVTLVTSRYEEPQIQQKCEQLGIKLLPKQLAGFVPMELEEIVSTTALAKYDWILIDDDPLVHMTWQFISKERQKTFLGFKSYKEFSESKQNIDPTSNFYIDSNLGDGIKGEVIAKKMHSEGYQNLFIATGYDPDQFKNLDYITDVIGKEPPMS
jgi:signal transduction histidine kinase